MLVKLGWTKPIYIGRHAILVGLKSYIQIVLL
jgi:hypothetical protein